MFHQGTYLYFDFNVYANFDYPTPPGAATKKRDEANLRSVNLLRSGSRSLKSQLGGNTCPSIQDFKNNKLPKSMYFSLIVRRSLSHVFPGSEAISEF